VSQTATGYTFFRVAESDEQWRLTVLHRILEALGGLQRIKEAVIFHEDTSKLSLEQKCERVALNQRGGLLKFDLAGFPMTLWFPRMRNQASVVQYLTLDTPAGAFIRLDPTLDIPEGAFIIAMKGDPMRVEVFAQEWVRLCEAQGAYVAFFPDGVWYNSEVMIPDYLETVERNDMLSIVQTSYWRTYLSPAAVKRFQEQLEQPWEGQSEQLLSGAQVFFYAGYGLGRGYNPYLGDRDVPHNTQFLLEQIEPHTEVAGSERLVGLLRQIAQRWPEIENVPSELEDYPAYERTLAQARARLDDVRAIWACARLQKGLVGVQQEVTIRQEDGITQQVYVPVIANEGRTWLIATLLHPFNLDEEAWNDPASGLATQVQRLLDTAKYQQSTGGEAPRVVVYFWRGVSEQVRQALQEMGAGVEVADHLPLLA
jgi:hypothetical protein